MSTIEGIGITGIVPQDLIVSIETSLPNELFQYAFSFLNLQDRKSADLVNRCWYSAVFAQTRAEQATRVEQVVRLILSKLDANEAGKRRACEAILAHNPVSASTDFLQMRNALFGINTTLDSILVSLSMQDQAIEELKIAFQLQVLPVHFNKLLNTLNLRKQLALDLQKAHSTPNPVERDRILKQVVETFIKMGDFKDAEHVAMLIPPSSNRNYALTIISGAFLKIDQFSEAERIAMLMPDVEERNSALYRISENFLKSNLLNFKEAERVVRLISPSDYQNLALRRIAEAFINQGDLTEAKRISLLIPRSSYHSDLVVSEIAKTFLSRDNFSEAERYAMLIPLNSNHARDATLLAITKAFVERGNFTEAERIAKLIHLPLVRDRALQLALNA
jgi:hypothetical protein